MIKYIVFDFDGTLADSSPLVSKILNKLSTKYGFKSFSREDWDYLKTLPSREVIKKLGIPRWKLPIVLYTLKSRMKKEIGTLELPNWDLAKLLSSIKKNENFKLGIVSSNSKNSIEEFLKIKDLNCFDFVYTINSLWKKENELRRLERKGILKLDETLYVGDETRDIISCKKAGIKCAAVTWGYNKKGILEKFEPDYLIESPLEILEILGIKK